MKIKTKEATYAQVMEYLAKEKERPERCAKKPNKFFRTIMRLAAIPDLRAVNFTYDTEGMEKLGEKEPCLILMNHSRPTACTRIIIGMR